MRKGRPHAALQESALRARALALPPRRSGVHVLERLRLEGFGLATGVPATLSGWTVVAMGLLATGACARTHNLTFETRSPEPTTTRHAPGVAVDPAHGLPTAQTTATDHNGLAVLRAPGNVQPDRTLVEEFFEAVTERDSSKLEQLLAPNAKTKSSAGATEIDALDFWKTRLARLDYGKLTGQGIYRPHSIEVYRAEDLAVLGGERHVPVEVGSGEIAVRVPLYTSEVDKARLFGSEIVFLLSPTDSGLRIAEIVEDFQLP